MCIHRPQPDKSDCDWSDIVGYLYKLDRSLTLRLGGELGLDNFKLTNMKDLPGDMVTALLRKQDKVKEKCGDTVTWQVLINALLKIGQTGIANDILKEKCGQNTSGLGSVVLVSSFVNAVSTSLVLLFSTCSTTRRELCPSD